MDMEMSRLKTAISEGEMILKSGKTANGRKMSLGELMMVQKSINNAKKKLTEYEQTTQ